MPFKKCFISLLISADNKDYAPFPDGLLGSPRLNEHTTQCHLLPGETLSSGFFIQYSETLPSSAQDFIDVTLAYKESALEFSDVPLAREDDHLGVLPDPDRRCEFHFIVSH